MKSKAKHRKGIRNHKHVVRDSGWKEQKTRTRRTPRARAQGRKVSSTKIGKGNALTRAITAARRLMSGGGRRHS